MYYTPFNQYKQSQPSLFSDICVKTYVTKMTFKINVPMTFKVLTAVTLWQCAVCSCSPSSGIHVCMKMEAARFSEMSTYRYRLHHIPENSSHYKYTCFCSTVPQAKPYC